LLAAEIADCARSGVQTCVKAWGGSQGPFLEGDKGLRDCGGGGNVFLGDGGVGGGGPASKGGYTSTGEIHSWPFLTNNAWSRNSMSIYSANRSLEEYQRRKVTPPSSVAARLPLSIPNGQLSPRGKKKSLLVGSRLSSMTDRGGNAKGRAEEGKSEEKKVVMFYFGCVHLTCRPSSGQGCLARRASGERGTVFLEAIGEAENTT